MITTGTTLDFPDLGTVKFTVRPTSHRITARWRDGMVVCNVPPGLSVKYVSEAIASMSERILRQRPALRYSDGQRFEFDGWTARINQGTTGQVRLLARMGTNTAELLTPPGFDFDSDTSTRRISALLCRIARSMAPRIIVPLAGETADRIGRHPTMWDISTGRRTLGTCDSRGVIHLSYMNMFLPRHLREYIICHELAHLSEMNHSSRFHSLCNSYCGGMEKQYILELRNFRWPVL